MGLLLMCLRVVVCDWWVCFVAGRFGIRVIRWFAVFGGLFCVGWFGGLFDCCSVLWMLIGFCLYWLI